MLLITVKALSVNSMEIRKKLQFGLLVGLLLMSALARAFLHVQHRHVQQPYSNVIIFGDSQSDIGNGPESLTFDNLSRDSSTRKIATTLYVPISNPVNVKKDTILPTLNLDFPPMRSHHKQFKLTLPKALPICSDGVCYKRKYRSLNWSEYFLYNGIKQGLFARSADLRPWVIQYSQRTQPTINQSVDYAWYSALSTKGCSHINFSMASCISNRLSLNKSIYRGQHQYRRNQSKTDLAKNKRLSNRMSIPSTQKQIEMFQNDLRSKKVVVNSKTLYVVWTAVNDIGVAFQRYQRKEISLNTLQNTMQVTIPNLIAGNNTQSIVDQLIKLGARHILVLGQYNLGLTPEALEKRHLNFVKRVVIKKVSKLIALYNTSLQQLITKNFNSKYVQYVDLQNPIDQVVFNLNSPIYAQTLGNECDEAVSQNKLRKGDAVSCYQNDISSPIGWWNKAHVSTQLNQMIAATVLNTLLASTPH